MKCYALGSQTSAAEVVKSFCDGVKGEFIREGNKYKGGDVALWGKIERFAKASAKRSINLPQFIEKFKIKMNCDSINPRWAEAGIKNDILLPINDGQYIEPAENKEQREFLTAAIAQIDDNKAIRSLYTQTAWIILLVRERLEREKPAEKFVKFEEKDKS